MATRFQNKISTKDGGMELVPCGLIVKQEGSTIGIPLVSVDVSIKIVSIGAEVTLRQKFVNNSKEKIQTTYFFPVETKVAVHFFKANLNGRVITSVVKGKHEAREEFAEAVSNNQTALLLEEVKSDIMEIYVGNFEAESECEITVKYIQEVDNQEGNPRFTLPTTIAPRYIPHGDENADKMMSLNFQYSVMKDIPISVQVDVFMKTLIKSISSPTHTLTETLKPIKEKDMLYHSKVELKCGTDVMDRDFVLVYEAEANDTVCVVEKGEDSTAVMLSFTPDLSIDETKCEFIFLVDCSGSMAGRSIEKACDALKIFVRSLPEDCFFNIYRFGSTFNKFFKKSKVYNDSSIEEATSCIKKTFSNLGGTEILCPLQEILKCPTPSGYKKQVIILTDGQVSNTSQVISLIKESDSRVFSLGIGAAASRELVKGMASAGKGVSSFCTLYEPMHNKVITLLNAAKVEPTTINKIVCHDAEGNEISFEDNMIYPSLPHYVYSNEKVTIFALGKNTWNCCSVSLLGSVGHEPLQVTFDEQYLAEVRGELIHKIVAAKLITEFVTDESRDFFKELAVKYNLVTSLTSLICVDTATKESVSSSVITESIDRDMMYQMSALRSNMLCSAGLDTQLCLSSNSLQCKSRKKKGGIFPSFSMPKRKESRMARSAPKTRKAASKSSSLMPLSEDELVGILELSNSKGVFSDLDKFCSIAGVAKAKLEKLNTLKVKDTIFLTYVCLIYLKLYHSNNEPAWSLVKQKAEKYLKSEVKDLSSLDTMGIENFLLSTKNANK